MPREDLRTVGSILRTRSNPAGPIGKAGRTIGEPGGPLSELGGAACQPRSAVSALSHAVRHLIGSVGKARGSGSQSGYT